MRGAAEIARRYTRRSRISTASRRRGSRDEAEHGWHLYVIQVEPDALRIDRDEFIKEMPARKIGVSVHFIPLHIHPYYRDRYGFNPKTIPNAFAAFQRIISLPDLRQDDRRRTSRTWSRPSDEIEEENTSMKRVFDICRLAPALVVLCAGSPAGRDADQADEPRTRCCSSRSAWARLRQFRILKFRTMVEDADQLGPGVTVKGDRRVTGIGAVLRKTKLDELPQLLNVLKGDMGLVGPRPELPAYVERYPEEFREVLRIRPGITDPASIVYRDESALLEGGKDPEDLYLNVILPHKLRLAKAYVDRASLGGDIMVIFKTLLSLMSRSESSDANNSGRIRRRRMLALVIDAVLVATAFYTALYLRHDGLVPDAQAHHYLVTVPFLVFIRVLLLLAFGLHRGRWRHAGLKSMESLTGAVILGSLAFWGVLRLGPNDEVISNQVLILEGLLSLAFLAGARTLWRVWGNFVSEPTVSRKVLVVGTGHSADGSCARSSSITFPDIAPSA